MCIGERRVRKWTMYEVEPSSSFENTGVCDIETRRIPLDLPVNASLFHEGVAAFLEERNIWESSCTYTILNKKSAATEPEGKGEREEGIGEDP